MKEKFNLHKIMCFAYSCCLVLIALVGGFMFGIGSKPITDTDLNKYSQSQDYQVGANNSTTTSFNGSNVSLPFWFKYSGYKYFPGLYNIFGLSATKTSNSNWRLSFNENLQVYYNENTYNYFLSKNTTLDWNLNQDNAETVFYSPSPTTSSSSFYVYFQHTYAMGNTQGLGDIVGCTYGGFELGNSSAFFDQINYRINFSSTYWTPYANNDSTLFMINYFDSNFSNFSIFFRLSFSTAFAGLLSPRTYFFANDNSNDYQLGYQDGFLSGVGTGNNESYNNGYDIGYDAGYNVGFNDGELNGTNYSFMSLIGAVVDAPVKAFMGLFNFEVFGIDMRGFITGILTFCLAMILLRYLVVK